MTNLPWLTPSQALSRFAAQPVTATESPELVLGQQVARFGFMLGKYGLLIDPLTTSEVLEPMPIHRIPNSMGAWLGLVNLRGNLVPVYDLSTILDWPHDRDKKIMMLFLGKGESSICCLIDGLPFSPMLDAPMEQTPNLPESLLNHSSSAYEVDGVVWVEFHHESFFQDYKSQISSTNS